MKKSVCFFLFLFWSGAAFAGSKIHTFDFEGDFKINVDLLKCSNIRLEAGEEISRGIIFLGDRNRWIVDFAEIGPDGKKTTVLVVKASEKGLKTNLVFGTDRRLYNLDLESDPKKPAHDNVKFRYPDAFLYAEAPEKKRKETTSALKLPGFEKKKKYLKKEKDEDKEEEEPTNLSENLNFDYSVTPKIDCAWKPIHIFNSDIKTFIYFPKKIKAKDLPILYASNGGKKRTVNYRYNGDVRRFVVDGVFENFVLTTGNGENEKLYITNNRYE